MTPGRWVALAVGVPVALALIGWTGFSLVTTVARGSYPFSYTIPVQDGQVAVNINAGDVTLQQAPGASTTARLTGTVQYGLIRPGISESVTPTGANIGMSCAGINTNCGMSASLDVPAQTAVTLWSNGGNITASGFSSGMTLSAAGGNVTATNLAGALQPRFRRRRPDRQRADRHPPDRHRGRQRQRRRLDRHRHHAGGHRRRRHDRQRPDR